MTYIINPIKLTGSVNAIISKSDAHRKLICAFLAGMDIPKYSKDFTNVSDDINVTLRCIEDLMYDHDLDCGESGSTLRFLIPVSAAIGADTTFFGHGRLPQRPLKPLLDVMKGCTFRVDSDKEGDNLPLKIHGKLEGGIYELPGNISSQYITGLLMALPIVREDSEIRLTTKLESAGYVDMTLKTLSEFGIKIEKTENGYKIPGNQTYKAVSELKAEGDWSNAAVFLCAGAIGESVTVNGLDMDSVQSDKSIVELLGKIGADVEIANDSVKVTKKDLKPVTIDVSQFPDLFPVLAVTLCAVDGVSVLENASRLRIKESDRIASTAKLINDLGGKAEEKEDALVIHGCGKLKGGIADAAGDHRIVMAAALASVISDDAVTINGAESVNKSYPTFAEDMKKLGGMFEK